MEFYSRLSTRSRRAFLRQHFHGRPYEYRPRGNLLARLASETGLSVAAVHEGLLKERRDALAQLP
ncbi:MAG: hypothetical protein KME19_08970 [Microcoleus vaginatus WJT46-NPBG5]|jgi:endonuclease/exonuclease/phosphatase family metal-dependent hydrolase|nr:hypothetical protein [Microcoleus vaginatus WJT46-NPBG5]MBW4680232.1 hypothetical protein [Microcoleus vaginatus WJT46-NPBG5]